MSLLCRFKAQFEPYVQQILLFANAALARALVLSFTAFYVCAASLLLVLLKDLTQHFLCLCRGFTYASSRNAAQMMLL